MVSLNSTVFIQIINFLVLIFALNAVFYKPVRRILAQRKEKISGLEQGIDKFEHDAMEKDLALKSGIKQAREAGLRTKEALEAEAREEEKRRIEKLNEKARADLEEIRARIVKDADAARKALLQQVDGFADDIARRILGRAV